MTDLSAAMAKLVECVKAEERGRGAEEHARRAGLLNDVCASYHYAVEHLGRPEDCDFGWCSIVRLNLRAPVLGRTA